MLELLKNIDQYVLLEINSRHNGYLDVLMQLLSGNIIWLPLYAYILYRFYRKYRINFVWFLLSIGLLIFLADRTSVLVFKDVFQRLRPCHDPVLRDFIHLVNNHCGGKYGFVSSHATNTAALASFLIRQDAQNKLLQLFLMIYVLLVGYSRVYLGVHYIIDIFGGWLWGIILGFTVSVFWENLLEKFDME